MKKIPLKSRPLEKSFDKTSLDLENPTPLGGPNRTNSSNIPSGQYVNIGASNMFGFSPKNYGATLKNKEGKIVVSQLHQYTPKNTYLQSFSLQPTKTETVAKPQQNIVPTTHTSHLTFKNSTNGNI